MGKNKRKNHPQIQDLIDRPWCYYCERDFDDYRVLLSHQKAKHFKCHKCNRRLNTAGGLSVHMNQVHKENINSIENALPNRASVELEIFGMEGVPDDIKQAHQQRVVQQYWEEAAERQARTGNPLPGVTGLPGPAVKKVKKETVEEIKARAAAWKAMKRSGSSGDVTPSGNAQSPAAFPAAGSPPNMAGQPAYTGAPAQAPFAQPYGQPQYPSTGFSQSPYQQPYAPGPQIGLPQGPPRPNSLPNAPGLPQRPQVAPPRVNPYEMQAMHQGHVPGEGSSGIAGHPADASSLDELISSAANQATEAAAARAASEEKKPEEKAGKKKKGKKDEKPTKLIFTSELASPEEKMAMIATFRKTRQHKSEIVLGEGVGAVAGTVAE